MFKHRQLLILSLTAFLLMLGDGMVLALLPKTVMNLKNSSLFVGYLASSYALAQVLSQLPIGMLAQRWGSKNFILMGYIASFFAGALFYVANNVNLIFLGRVFQGIGEAPILSLVPALLSLRYPADKGKAIGIYNASLYLGLTLGPFLRVVLLSDWPDQYIFLLYAAVSFLGAVVVRTSMAKEETNQSTTVKTVNITNLLGLLKTPQTIVVIGGIALYGAGFGIFMTMIPSFLLTVKEYDQSYINIYFSLFYIAISMAQLAIGWLSDRLGRERFMVMGMTAAALGLALFSYFDRLTLSSLLCFSSFGLGAYYLASMAFLNEKVPASYRSAISGIYYIFWGTGMFWGPLLLNYYMQYNSYQSGFQMLSALMLLQVTLLLITKSNLSWIGKELLQK